jgi:hypothetical protein
MSRLTTAPGPCANGSGLTTTQPIYRVTGFLSKTKTGEYNDYQEKHELQT